MSKIKVLFLATVFTFGLSATVVQNDKLYEITKNIEIFVNVFQQLNTNFVDEIDPGELMKIGIDAMVGSLDPYTNYISESQVESYRLSNEGKYQGIGAIVEKVGDYITIIEPYQNGAALKAGLKAGDQIISLNGFDTKGKSSEEVNAIAMGVAGTNINLEVQRPGKDKPLNFSLTRSEVNIPNVPYSGRVSDRIGYISLTIFTADASKNVAKALKELKKEGPLDGVILDLRQNGGGLLREAIAVSNVFIPTGKEVVTTKGKIKERDQSYKTVGAPIDVDIPLAVLIDGRSASASEIVSGVIQDYDRGVLIGQRSYGKGLVQNTQEVGYNSRIKLTTSKYYIPSRRCIQSVEYKNGEPVDIPDDRRSVFKTAKGRPVLDGGGVTPDVKMEDEVLAEYTQALLNEYVIFHFVNDYVQRIDTIESIVDYTFSDYEEFVAYVEKSDFKYQSELEKEMRDLLAKDTDVDVDSDILKVIEKIEKQTPQLINDLKDEISKEIEREIITRFYFQSGKAQQKLNGDPEVQRAIEILSDQDIYQSILSVK